MAEPIISLKSRPSALVQRKMWPPESRRGSAFRLQLMPSRPLPLRVAVVGNHLARQCGIATFTAQSYMRSFIQNRANHVHPARLAFSTQTGEKSATSQRPSPDAGFEPCALQ
jgi:hypothetical protein